MLVKPNTNKMGEKHKNKPSNQNMCDKFPIGLIGENLTQFYVKFDCKCAINCLFVCFVIFDQARGPKKHLKRLNAPKAWMLDKLGGVFAPRPSTGPHKLRESLPLVIFLRNRLKYALVSIAHTAIKKNHLDICFYMNFNFIQTNSEVTKIVMQRLIKVDGKVRTDTNFPAGFMGK